MKRCAVAPFHTAAVFWYKPNSSHKHMYPALKNAEGEPIQTTTDGKISYTLDPDGIEIFNTR